MADESAYAPRHDNKRRLDDSPPPPWPARRQSGFSSPLVDGQSGAAASYNSVPPPPDGIQLAKQRAQEIAAKIFSEAGAKRPKVENGVSSGDESSDKGFGSGPSGLFSFLLDLSDWFDLMLRSGNGFLWLLGFITFSIIH